MWQDEKRLVGCSEGLLTTRRTRSTCDTVILRQHGLAAVYLINGLQTL